MRSNARYGEGNISSFPLSAPSRRALLVIACWLLLTPQPASADSGKSDQGVLSEARNRLSQEVDDLKDWLKHNLPNAKKGRVPKVVIDIPPKPVKAPEPEPEQEPDNMPVPEPLEVPEEETLSEAEVAPPPLEPPVAEEVKTPVAEEVKTPVAEEEKPVEDTPSLKVAAAPVEPTEPISDLVPEAKIFPAGNPKPQPPEKPAAPPKSAIPLSDLPPTPPAPPLQETAPSEAKEEEAPPETTLEVPVEEPVEIAVVIQSESAPIELAPDTLGIAPSLTLGADKQDDDRSCISKHQRHVQFCVRDVIWPQAMIKRLEINGNGNKKLQAIARYDGKMLTHAHVLFPQSKLDDVAAYFDSLFGPPLEILSRIVTPFEGRPTNNPTLLWRKMAVINGTEQSVTLEIRQFDDSRGAFPDMEQGFVRLYGANSLPIFPRISPREIMLMKYAVN